MDSHLLIVAILTVGFSLASLLAYVAQRLHLPSILGYLLAGFIIGPFSPGFVADLTIAEQLAEIGVILMLFGVGLHFKLEDLISVKNIAIPGAAVQTISATVLATLIMMAAGWSWEAGLIMGLSVGVASTVVLVRVLSDNHLLNTQEGHIAIGWLVVEDIFTVIILILIPTLAVFTTEGNLSIIGIAGTFSFVILKFVMLALFMFTWGHKIVAYILTNVARLRSQELFTLTVLALVFLIATGSAFVFGTSIALGAFIAGMVIGKTNVRHQAAANALPLKDIFAIIFFLSVGMLFNPIAIYNHFLLFLGILGVILIVKPLSAYLLTISFGYSLSVALTVAVSLAQIGEFSFILAEEAIKFKLLSDDGYDILVACALVSISINPLLFQMIGFFETKMKQAGFCKQKTPARRSFVPPESSQPHAIVVGFGPIGREVSAFLKESGLPTTIIESNIDTVSELEHHDTIIFGDAAEINILESAHLKKASHLFLTIPHTAKALSIIESAYEINPKIKILARVKYIQERALMEERDVHYVCTEVQALEAYLDLVKRSLAATKPEV